MPRKDKGWGTTVKELAPPVLVTCPSPGCGHQFWVRKRVAQDAGSPDPAPVCPKCGAAAQKSTP